MKETARAHTPGGRTVRYCRGPGLLHAVRSATENVERHVSELNALNVYPVPDGDTGINMIATMRAALAEVESMPGDRLTLSDLAAAVSFGALMGARGNSGVILSQVFRGMAESVAGKRRADGRDLAEALMAGTRTAYGAVARPVEGTILTVAHEAAHAAMEAAERGEPLGVVLAVATDAARFAVERTPEQLDVLREAGVVDAGGQGLYRALEGALRVIAREPEFQDLLPPRPVPRSAPVTVAEPLAGPDVAEDTWGYETVFLLQGREPLDVEGIRRGLEAIGESVLVAGDARMVKVHVHNDRPDAVLAVGLSLGSVSQVAVQNLDHQARLHGEARPTAPATDLPEPAGRAALTLEAGQGAVAGPALAVVAVAAGDGLAEIFGSFGVEQVIAAPRTGKPSTGELVDAICRTDARAVIVLPNDPDVVLASDQAARACPDKEVVVVPTRSAPEGFAALLAMDPAAGARANLAPMLAAAREVQTLLVAVADRAAQRADRTIRPGQYVVMRPGEGIASTGDEAPVAIAEAVDGLAPRFELLTLYLGEGASPEEAEEVARLITERRPGTEIEVLPGGQPHYRYVISAE